jgi:hypothetical protein
MSISVGSNKWPYRAREPKDPNATLDYQIDWSNWLATGESIVSAVWTVTGATLTTSVATAKAATVWLSGGTVGTLISATCRITTDSAPVARIDDRTLLLTVSER